MYKTIGIIIILSLLVFSAGSVLAKTEKGSSMADLIQMLQEQIEKLKAQIEALIIQIENWKDSRGDIRETEEEAKELLKILKELKRGMKGDDVQLLQEFLATDPQIYPEGYTTGYFGPLTEKAVKNFQELAGIEDEDGVVGSKTLSKINELLEEGAGSSGKVPPGLLIAPGIRKKIGYEPEVPEGQKLPPGIQKKLDGGDGN
jgi:peptidoglycan hydrolase-like protein with peptidoglycan-binding domain